MMNKEHFIHELQRNYESCEWSPDTDGFSVFNQWDASYYLAKKDAFIQKYKLMFAVAKTAAPAKLIELGCHAGSSMDAYVSGANCEYIGMDLFTTEKHESAPDDWKPKEIAEKLITKRGFQNCRLIECNFRDLAQLETADFVAVDGWHDFRNAYEDMMLALTAQPDWIFIDDLHGKDVSEAWAAFQGEFVNRIEWSYEIEHHDGSVLAKIRR